MDEVDTTTTGSCVTASVCENMCVSTGFQWFGIAPSPPKALLNSTITNNLEHWKVPTIVRMENVRTKTSTDREEKGKRRIWV